MQSLFLIIVFTSFAATSFGQNRYDSIQGMSPEQNVAWLSEVKNADKERQLVLIQDRYFRQSTFKKSEIDDRPLLVVDGIPMSDQMDLELRNFLAYEITSDKVDITILDKEPEALYVNKRWAGVILLNITDRKTRRKMYR